MNTHLALLLALPLYAHGAATTAAAATSSMPTEQVSPTIEITDDYSGTRICHWLRCNSELIGFIEWRCKTEQVACIDTLYIKTAHQGKGYGSQLLRYALEKIGSLKYSIVTVFPTPIAFENDDLVKQEPDFPETCDKAASTKLYNFYAKHGFVSYGLYWHYRFTIPSASSTAQ
jgi:GNAT superfamily N-acetyltransferase